ncbi:MAG TPA: hypothetical protein PKK94_24795 [Leptospiraceae bacterium]|nr:hypothetical protein [Leptospiraceae bacterium]
MKVFAGMTSVPENEILSIKYIRQSEPDETKGINFIQNGQYFRIIADNFSEAYEMLIKDQNK